MNYRKIIADAWQLTQSRKELFWWFGFFPALLQSVVSIVYLSYQFVAFSSSPLFDEDNFGHEIFSTILDVAKTLISEQTGLAVLLVVLIALVGVAYLMLPVFTEGALIQLLARIRAGEQVSMIEGISFGFSRFLQLFEYHLAVKTFSIVSLLTYAALVLRILGVEAFLLFIWIFLLFAIVGLLLGLFFTYSEFFIVIDRKNVFSGMMASGSLVIRHWHHTLFMFILMLIISVRIIFNLLIALLIPLLVIAPIFIFATFTLAKIGVFIGVIIGLIGLYFSAYFLGIFEVFARAVWTFTFLELSSKKDPDLHLLSKEIEAQKDNNV